MVMSSEINKITPLTVMKTTTVPAENNVQDSSTANQANHISNVSKINQHDTNTLTLASVKAATEQSSQLLQSTNLSVQYSVDNATQEMVIKVVDSNGKLVRQIPSVEMLDFVKRLESMEDKQKGTVIQTRA